MRNPTEKLSARDYREAVLRFSGELFPGCPVAVADDHARAAVKLALAARRDGRWTVLGRNLGRVLAGPHVRLGRNVAELMALGEVPPVSRASRCQATAH